MGNMKLFFVRFECVSREVQNRFQFVRHKFSLAIDYVNMIAFPSGVLFTV
jgi:hypothetical protein